MPQAVRAASSERRWKESYLCECRQKLLAAHENVGIPNDVVLTDGGEGVAARRSFPAAVASRPAGASVGTGRANLRAASVRLVGYAHGVGQPAA